MPEFMASRPDVTQAIEAILRNVSVEVVQEHNNVIAVRKTL
jgi:hypothetical protein